jgi:hypothetical protein
VVVTAGLIQLMMDFNNRMITLLQVNRQKQQLNIRIADYSKPRLKFFYHTDQLHLPLRLLNKAISGGFSVDLQIWNYN